MLYSVSIANIMEEYNVKSLNVSMFSFLKPDIKYDEVLYS